MATPIDDKVVAMSFESSKFEKGVDSTISALDKLKKSLEFPHAGKGLDEINAAAKRVDLSHIGQSVDQIRDKLHAFRFAALSVFADIAKKAFWAGANILKAFTIEPIKAGFQEYETQMGAIQTILSNTASQGTKLKDVNKALNELNTYADKTIYNFTEMTKNIGTFTAAGVDLKTAVGSIKGIANVAALSGSNAMQASTAMYQLSQAIATGTVRLQDWRSVENASMGGALFQRALADTAVHMGTLSKNALTLTGHMKTLTVNGQSFRNSLAAAGPGKKSWLTSDVLTTTLKQLSGDLTDAQLKAKGYTDAQVKALQTQAKMAVDAATKVKTLSQLLDTTKEAVGSGWAQTWQIIFGDFGEAKTLFTNLSNAIGGFVKISSNARNKVLADWKDLGGRTLLINSLKTAFRNLAEIVKPIKDAFRDIFPAKTGRDLYEFTQQFQRFVETIKPSPQTIENLRRTFRGLFALLDIGKQLIGGIFTVFGRLFGAVSTGNNHFLKLTGSVGDFLVYVDRTLKKGNRLHNFFVKLGDILAVPMKALGRLSNALGNLFGKFSPGAFSHKIDGMSKAMSPFERIVVAVARAFDHLVDAIENANLQPAIDAIVKVVTGFGTAIGKAASQMNFEAILEVIRTGLFAGLFVIIKRFLGKGSLLEQLSKTGGGFVKNIAGTFDALRGSMVALQQNIKARTLKEIAIAIGLLAASTVALSFVNPERLKSSLSAMTVAFGELLGAMKILTIVTSTAGFYKLPIIVASLILLGGAIDTLSIAVVALGQLSWNELLKGLSGVAALLIGITAAAIPLSANSAGMIRAGAGISAMAFGLNLMAIAVRQFAGLNLSELAKGLGAAAVGLGVMASAMEIIPTEKIIVAGLGITAIAFGLNLLALAVRQFASMNLKDSAKGLLGIGGALAIIAGAMHLMPEGMVAQAAGLLIVSFALGKIAKAVVGMAQLSWKEIARGLAALGGALVILAGAMMLMQEAVGGAVALTVASVGILALSKALIALGGQSWTQILKGLVSLAGAFIIIGAAAILLTEAIPSMLGFGVALVLIGAGLALAGAGIALIGTGLSAIAVSGTTAIGILITAIAQFEAAIIKNAKNLILGLLQIVQALSDVAPKFVTAIVKILGTVVDALIKLTPKLVQLIQVLVDAIVKVLSQNQGKIIQAAIDLILALLKGIRDNIAAVVNTVVDIIIAFVNAIAQNISKIVSAGVNILMALIKGIAGAYSKVISTAINIVVKFVQAIAANIGKIVSAGLSIVAKLLGAIATGVSQIIRAGTNLIVKFVEGIGNAGPRVARAGTNAMIKFMNALVTESLKLVNAGALAIIRFLNGVAKAIDKYEPEMMRAGNRIGIAIAKGMIKGMAGMAVDVANAAKDLGKGALSSIGHHLGINSPSKAFVDVGQSIVEGLTKGMSDHKDVINSAAAMGTGVVTAVKKVLQITSPSKVMYEIGGYVSQGFAQGIRGSSDDIRNAFTDMNSKLTEAMQKARETIVSEQAKLNQLRAANKPDAQAIREAQATIAQNEALLRRSNDAHIALIITLRAQKTQLIGLADDYQRIGDKLKVAQQALADAKRAREDAIKGFADQYSTLPDISTTDGSANQLAAYIDALKHQTDAVAAYQSTLDQLRKLGLDDATYQKLVSEGTADQAFADQLLAGGKTAVQGLNALDKQLKANAKVLAQHAGKDLYQAGVDAAQGIVKGLKSQMGSIAKQMEAIARAMVRALKNELGIRSPSQVFAEIGRYSMLGMAQGFSDASSALTDAAKSALDDVTKTVSDISDVLANEINTNPVITPVLDLTQIRSQTGELAAMTNVTPITAAVSYGQATAISSQQQVAQAEEPVVAAAGTMVKFEQNNYSPESLSDIEIYRQTKNQLATFKTAFEIP